MLHLPLVILLSASLLGAAERTVFDLTLPDAHGQPYPLLRHSGGVVLVLPVATHCPLISQLAEFQARYASWHARGLTLLAVPVTGFMGMEPTLRDDEIATFCRSAYGVEFPILARQPGRGEAAHPLFIACGGISWPFTKLVIGRDGRLVARFAPAVTAADSQLEAVIATALQAPGD